MFDWIDLLMAFTAGAALVLASVAHVRRLHGAVVSNLFLIALLITVFRIRHM
jgi:hypothetical protein